MMYWVRILFGFMFIALDKIIEFVLKRPLISALVIFGVWVTLLPLPEENSVRENSVTLLDQNQKLDMDAEYRALLGSNQHTVIPAAFRGKLLAEYSGKFLAEYKVGVDEATKDLKADFRIVQVAPKPSKTSANIEDLDVSGSIPEERVLLKLYQLPSFGVQIPAKIDLKYARELPTQKRLEYLRDRTDVAVIKKAYQQFLQHLDNDDTQIYLGKFGEKFDDTKTYSGFYAHNPKTKNMMFFRKDSTSESGHTLHSYMKLTDKKNRELEQNHSIF